MERRIPPTPLLSSPNVLNAFRKGSALAGLVALGAMLGCGAPEDGDESADIETQTDQIVSIDPISQTDEFKYLSPIFPLSTGTGDPAFCTPNAPHSMIVFTRDTSGFIQGAADDQGSRGSWGKYGGSGTTRKLGGRPACGFLAGTTSPYSFILLAKGATVANGSSDKHLFWSKGSWTYAPQTSPAPSAQTPWAAMDPNTQFNTNGNPAVGTHNGQLVVVYLKDNGQLAANYWTGNGFSATLDHPALPAGWTGVGTPTIAFAESWAGKFIIFVRVKNSMNQYKLYETFFQDTHFTSAAGGPTGVYWPVTLPAGAPAIQSDPAYEFDNVESFQSGTLYYRNGTRLYHVSASNGVDQFENSTIKPILMMGSAPNITGNPVVLGGVYYEPGTHWVLARGGSSIYFGESVGDEYIAPN